MHYVRRREVRLCVMDILHDNRPAVTGPATAAVSGSIDVPTGALAMIDASTETWIRRPSKPGSAAERLLRPEDFVEFSLLYVHVACLMANRSDSKQTIQLKQINVTSTH